MVERYNGIPVSKGIVIGTIYKYLDEMPTVEVRRISREEINFELDKVKIAREKASCFLEKLKETAEKDLGTEGSMIFEATIAMLNDPVLLEDIKKNIKDDLINAEGAIKKAIDSMVTKFKGIDDEYFQQRIPDVQDVGKHLLRALKGEFSLVSEIPDEAIVVSSDLAPSETALLDKSKLKGFVLTKGGQTSHTVILARGLMLPAVIKVEIDLSTVQTGDRIILNGNTGEVILEPDSTDLTKYEVKIREYQEKQKKLAELKDKPAITRDNFKIQLAANMGTDDELDAILDTNSDGIGIFRTEFLYMNNNSLPDEETQYQVYRKVAKKMKDKPVIIRTLDIGGDKELPYLELPREMNPFLGFRAIRFCLEREDIFLVQLKAILRAAQYGNLKIMFPLISSLEELDRAKKLLDKAKLELTEAKISFNSDIEVGMMIEVPAAAIMADELARQVDFFSIGTNDLIQYTMAADRTNELVAKLHSPYYPAIIRLIKRIVDSAHRADIKVGICGEAAGNPLLTPIFIGMGIDELSMSVGSILEIKQLVRKLDQKKCRKKLERVIKLTTAEQVKEYLKTL
ncbi:MAG: phosphoenolpyruvate--protein phosphotransferase [Firmicutes bacterium]|nr:phosphoenolpyruvate--protein phosphotransferase [Bacillota bacterium]